MITDQPDHTAVIAKENALKKGIINVEFRAFDVCELTFASNTFDSVSWRKGFMFFADILLAAKEILRVLKPDDRFATSVWSTPN